MFQEDPFVEWCLTLQEGFLLGLNMKNIIDLTNKVFNRLKVIKFSHRSTTATYWHVLCLCGTKRIVNGGDLKNGHTQSCGCLNRERSSNRHRKHGMRKTKTWNCWQLIKARCLNTKNQYYYLYGGRGIEICDKWLNSFENFLADMGEKPDGKSIDRIDTNGNYDPKNCRWSDAYEQANNTRTNVKIEYNGEILTLSQWARRMNLQIQTLSYRLKQGWPIEDALKSPTWRQAQSWRRIS